MPRRQRNNFRYYAVLTGFGPPAPGIFSSWAEAHSLTSHCSHGKCKGFQLLEDARTYLSSNGLFEYEWSEFTEDTVPRIGIPRGSERDETERAGWYSVARGRTRGVYDRYFGGAEPEVVRYSGACHKRFDSAEAAERFRQEWRQIAFYITHMRRMQDAAGVEVGYW